MLPIINSKDMNDVAKTLKRCAEKKATDHKRCSALSHYLKVRVVRLCQVLHCMCIFILSSILLGNTCIPADISIPISYSTDPLLWVQHTCFLRLLSPHSSQVCRALWGPHTLKCTLKSATECNAPAHYTIIGKHCRKNISPPPPSPPPPSPPPPSPPPPPPPPPSPPPSSPPPPSPPPPSPPSPPSPPFSCPGGHYQVGPHYCVRPLSWST